MDNSTPDTPETPTPTPQAPGVNPGPVTPPNAPSTGTTNSVPADIPQESPNQGAADTPTSSQWTTPQPTNSSSPTTPIAQPPLTQPNSPSGHISNPFVVVLQGAKKLFVLNSGSLAAMFGVTVGLAILLVIIIMLMSTSLISLLVQSSPEVAEQLMAQTDGAAAALAESSSAGSIVGIIVGVVVIIVIATFLTAMQSKLVVSGSLGRKIGFGELFKVSLKRTLPLLGLMALIIGGALAIGILIALFNSIPVLSFLLILGGLVAGFFLAVRLAYTYFVLVEENLGPIQSFKRSWQLTRGRFAEAMGAMFATTLIFGVPFVILEGLAAASGNVGLQLLAVILSVVSGVVASAGLAERYVQHRHLTDSNQPKPKVHLLNYFSPLIFLGAIIISSLIIPKPPVSNDSQDYFNSQGEELNSDAALEEYLRGQGLDSSEFDYNIDEAPSSPSEFNFN